MTDRTSSRSSQPIRPEDNRFPSAHAALTELTRAVPDFPEPGVVFQDLTPVLADPEAFARVVDELADAAERDGADLIGGLDARGFLLGAAVAYKLGLGVLAIRKAGKLPPPVYQESYQLEYGSASLEVPAQGGCSWRGGTWCLSTMCLPPAAPWAPRARWCRRPGHR